MKISAGKVAWKFLAGAGGFAHISRAAFDRRFLYGAFREGALAGMQ